MGWWVLVAVGSFAPVYRHDVVFWEEVVTN